MSAGASQAMFTVFTATYNRAHTLHRVYESLKAQTCRNFEWLIIDDGSTDGTDVLVNGWKDEAGFPIHYRWKENEGKHIAINLAVETISTEYIVILDSDDACVPEALERFEHHWQSISGSDQNTYLSVEVLCEYENGELVGDRFPDEMIDSNLNDMRFRHRVRGEKWGCQRVAAMREVPFPNTIKHTLVPEGLIWIQLARRFKTRFVNEVLRVYYEDQPCLSRGKLLYVRDGAGMLMYYRMVLNDLGSYFFYCPHLFVRNAINCARYGRCAPAITAGHAGSQPPQRVGENAVVDLLARRISASLA